MSAVGPGDKVRCRDASPHLFTGEVLLVLGRVYRIAGVAGGHLIVGGLLDLAWLPARFEPLGRRSFDHLLHAPTPAVGDVIAAD